MLTDVSALAVPVHRDKGLEITLRYPDGTTETVRYELHVFDPATDGPGGHTKLLRDIVDREKFDLLTTMTTPRHPVGLAQLAIAMGGAMGNLATADLLPTRRRHGF